MKHNKKRRLLLQSIAVFMTGKSTIVYGSEHNNTIRTHEEIIIQRPIKDVFSYVTQLENAHKISAHLTNVKIINNTKGKGGQYSRNLDIHGVSNKQIVTVTNIKHERLYKTRTELFGVEVRHTYHFRPVSKNMTKISLVKEAPIKNWIDYTLKAFVKHQMNRPEHDGQHLLVIKTGFESVNKYKT